METIIKLQVSEPAAMATANVTFANAHLNLANANKLKNGVDTDRKIATMEPDYFRLNGSFTFFKHDAAECGFVSINLSDENGNYANAGDGGKITITFAAARIVKQITIEGSRETDDFVSKIQIDYYNGNSIIISKSVDIAEVTATICESVENVTNVVIWIMATNKPYRRGRITSLYFDDVVVFRGKDVQSANALMECSPTAAELPFGTFDATVLSDVSTTFDVASSESLYGKLKEQLPLDVFFSSENGLEKIGRYYLTEWETPSPYQLKLQACDAIGLLDDIPYSGDQWQTPSPVVTNAKRVTRGARGIIPEIRLAAGFAPSPFKGYVKPGTTREALQQVLFAAGAWFDIADDGALVLTPQAINDTTAPVAFEFGIGVKALADQALKVAPDKTSVEIISNTEVYNGTLKELARYDQLLGVEEIRFDKSTKITQVTGCEIVEQEPFRCVISPTGAGQVIVKGLQFDVITGNHTAIIGTPSQRKNVLKVDGATMVNLANVETVLARLLIFAQQKYTQTWKAFNPAFKRTNQRVRVTTINGKQFNGVVTRVSIDLSGGGICEFEAIGFVGDSNATGTKRIIVGVEGIVTPAAFSYPTDAPQSFIAQLKSAYAATHGIDVLIDGNLTRYMTSPVSFTLPSANVNTSVQVTFPNVTKAITVGQNLTCTPALFRYPVAEAQLFTVAKANMWAKYAYYIAITINGVKTLYDIDTKPFTLTNTTETTTVKAEVEEKPRKNFTVNGWYDPDGGDTFEMVNPNTTFYYPVIGTQGIGFSAPYVHTGEYINGVPVSASARMDVRWYVNGVLKSTQYGVEFAGFDLSNATAATNVRADVSNIQSPGGGGGGNGSGGGSGYDPWAGHVGGSASEGAILRDSPNNGNFLSSLERGARFYVIGEETGTPVSGNNKWYNVQIISSDQYPNAVGLVGWLWSGLVVAG